MFMYNITKDKESGQIEINIDGNFTAHHKKLYLDFQSNYEVEHLALPTPILEYKPLKKIKERTCRFCNKSYPKVTFKKKAHVIPQLIGNKEFKSDEECDNCNLKFGRYENDLANFLGIIRTLSMSKGQEGIPTFKNPDKKLTIRDSGRRKNLIEIISEGNDIDHLKIDEKNKKITIEAIKASYKPINVYKSLLKVALALIPVEELDNYKKSMKVLMTNKFDDKLKGNPFMRLLGYFVPGIPVTKPIAFLWKKRSESLNDDIPFRVLSIYFQTYIYQVFITHDLNDRHLYNNKNVKLKVIPPFIDKSWIKRFGEPGFFNIDLSDSEVKRGEPQKITLTFDKINRDVKA